MNNQSIEKLLREKASLLPQANFPLITAEIEQPRIQESRRAKSRTVNPIFRIALAIISIILCTLGVCFGVSAEFRHTVMSLFRANSPEVVPSLPSASLTADNNTIQFIGKQNIAGLADVSYFDFGGYSVLGDVASVQLTDGSMKYYALEGDRAVEITPDVTHVTDVVEFNGRTLFLDFEYGTLNGKPFLRNIIAPGDRKESPSAASAFYDENTVWIDAGWGGQATAHAYYLLYDLNTRTATDVLAGVVTDDKPVDTIVFSPDKQKMILTSFNGGWPGECTYFDAVTKKATPISEFIGNDRVYLCSFANNDTLFIELYHNELHVNMTDDEYTLSGYCYSLNNGVTTKLFSENDFIVYASQGVCILKGNNEYKLVDASGEKYTVEGMDLEVGYSYLLNPDHTKIAILNSTNEKSNSLSVSEIGIMDLTKKEIKTFERKGYAKNDEVMISWNDNSSLVITTSGSAFSVYRFK